MAARRLLREAGAERELLRQRLEDARRETEELLQGYHQVRFSMNRIVFMWGPCFGSTGGVVVVWGYIGDLLLRALSCMTCSCGCWLLLFLLLMLLLLVLLSVLLPLLSVLVLTCSHSCEPPQLQQQQQQQQQQSRRQPQSASPTSSFSEVVAKGREAFVRERSLREEAELRYARVRAALDEQVCRCCRGKSKPVGARGGGWSSVRQKWPRKTSPIAV